MTENYVLYVTGGDYVTWDFEEKFNAQQRLDLVIQMINDQKDNLSFNADINIEIELHKFGVIDNNFIKFIRNSIQTREQRKHSNFYIFTKTQGSLRSRDDENP